MNVHYHLVVPDGVFVADEDTGELSLLRLRGPIDDDLLAILERVADRIAEQLADEATDREDADEHVDSPPDLWSRLQTEAATTWRSPPRPLLTPGRSETRSIFPRRRWLKRTTAPDRSVKLFFDENCILVVILSDHTQFAIEIRHNGSFARKTSVTASSAQLMSTVSSS